MTWLPVLPALPSSCQVCTLPLTSTFYGMAICLHADTSPTWLLSLALLLQDQVQTEMYRQVCHMTLHFSIQHVAQLHLTLLHLFLTRLVCYAVQGIRVSFQSLATMHWPAMRRQQCSSQGKMARQPPCYSRLTNTPASVCRCTLATGPLLSATSLWRSLLTDRPCRRPR